MSLPRAVGTKGHVSKQEVTQNNLSNKCAFIQLLFQSYTHVRGEFELQPAPPSLLGDLLKQTPTHTSGHTDKWIVQDMMDEHSLGKGEPLNKC